MGIEHIKELNDQALINVQKGNADLLKDDRMKLLGEMLRPHYLSTQPSVTVLVGDGRLGYPEGAPFDAIHVGAAAPVVPQAVSG